MVLIMITLSIIVRVIIGIMFLFVKATIRCSCDIYYLCSRMNVRQPTGTHKLILEGNKRLTCYSNKKCTLAWIESEGEVLASKFKHFTTHVVMNSK